MTNSSRRRSNSGYSTIELALIFVVAVILAGFVASKYQAIRQTRRDDTRKNDITQLQLGIQSYWAQTGNFPSLAQMDSAGFRANSLNKLDPSAAQDPRWNSGNKYCATKGKLGFEDSLEPHTGCFGYVPSPSGCDNKDTACSGYSLSAKLEAGGYYSQSSS